MSAAEPEVVAPEPDTKRKRGRVAVEQALMEREETTAIAHRGSQMVETLMAKAIESGNLDAMERVMAIRRELKAEAAREAFFAALSAFQAECPIIPKTKAVKDGGNTLYHYAPMDRIVEMVGPLLTHHGLSYKIVSEVIRVEGGDDLISATCHVYHEAGHSESSEFRVPIGEGTRIMSKPQKFAAAGSFAKRYAFNNALGILTGDEDDDTNLTPAEARAMRGYTQKAPEPRKPVSQPRPTPTSQKATQKQNGATERRDLEPAVGEIEAIDETMAKTVWQAMQHATLSLDDFKRRFPKLGRLGEVRFADIHVVTDWIASPDKN